MLAPDRRRQHTVRLTPAQRGTGQGRANWPAAGSPDAPPRSTRPDSWWTRRMPAPSTVFPDPTEAAQAKIFTSKMAIKEANYSLQLLGAGDTRATAPRAHGAGCADIHVGTTQILRTLVVSCLLGRRLPQTRDGYLSATSQEWSRRRKRMAGEIGRLSAPQLKAQLHDGGEIALLDAREEGIFNARHLLLASCVPLSRLELLIDDLVPRRTARVVWCDDGDGTALLAARRMAALGYQNVAVLEGGIAAWETAGYRLYSGVHVPSKAFAEVVEREAGTPWISAPDLKALIDSGADIAIFDSRSYEEYHNNSIPSAISVPGAELVYRFADLTPSPDTTVIVNCGGRTRSIIGAQALRNAGFRNKVMSLKDGTMAWHLAGFEVVHGATQRPPDVSEAGRQAAMDAAVRVAERCGIARIDKATLAAWRAEADRRTVYVLDVRTPEEYRAGHLAAARLAPGGQLVQETDAHIATWNARVVLVDDNGVRATMTASWLKQMGWTDVAVLVASASGGDWEKGPHVPRVLGVNS